MRKLPDGSYTASVLSVVAEPFVWNAGLGATDTGHVVPHAQAAASWFSGDVNEDDLVNAADIDAVFAAIASGVQDAQFDLNEDKATNSADADYLIESILETRAGDVNLDGLVDFDDFLVLSANFGKTGQSWATGDLNGNDTVDFTDFLLLSANFGFDADESVGDVLAAAL